ncbi:hypothetical protein EUX98_g1910 [Antrodiella citrinella]|uniref:Uncharacterized protein n=1 Tax=Antrodiella citrinella TaxID=2447956 RepID=A0A4S4N368_9APHY|nr:hypothetical protein EUX98_g1910 [Antrodiella citrinella]
MIYELSGDDLLPLCMSSSPAKRVLVRPKSAPSQPDPPVGFTPPRNMMPDELLEDILLRVWLSRDWDSYKQRWYFYRSAMMVNHQWRTILHPLMLRYAIFESLVDFQVYEFLIKKHVEDVRGREPLETEDIPAGSSSTEIRKDSWMLFNTSLIRVPGSRTTWYSLSEFPNSQWLRLLLRSCRRCEFHMRDHCRISDCRVFGSEGQSLRTVTFVITSSLSIEDINTLTAADASRFPNVTTLHIFHSQNADLKRISTYLLEVKAILILFPNLKHLTLDSSVSLLSLTSLLTHLETLTLDVPPVYIQDSHATSLMGWNISAALKVVVSPKPEGENSSSNPGERMFRPKKITIITEETLPTGWHKLAEACEHFGVKLVHHVGYTKDDAYPGPLTAREAALENIRLSMAGWEFFEILPIAISKDLETLMEHCKQETEKLKNILQKLDDDAVKSDSESQQHSQVIISAKLSSNDADMNTTITQ